MDKPLFKIGDEFDTNNGKVVVMMGPYVGLKHHYEGGTRPIWQDNTICYVVRPVHMIDSYFIEEAGLQHPVEQWKACPGEHRCKNHHAEGNNEQPHEWERMVEP